MRGGEGRADGCTATAIDLKLWHFSHLSFVHVLTLPVRRYFISTPSFLGGGGGI